MSIELFGLTFYAYGFVIGCAVVSGLMIAFWQSRKTQIGEREFWRVVTVVLWSGVVGARLWHVMIDWSLYAAQPWEVFFVWQGGLSILGAVIGGVIGLTMMVRRARRWCVFADLAALSLPIAQAIGRVANGLNQELYGLPTQLPWGVSIDVENRASGFEQFSRFHPLFAYEAFGLLFGALIMWFLKERRILSVGSGKLFLAYLVWYGCLRSGLEFLRIEKMMISGTSIGFNQAVVAGVAIVAAIVLFAGFQRASAPKKSAIEERTAPLSLQELRELPVRTQVRLVFPDRKELSALTVEVVNTPESLALGLSGRAHIDDLAGKRTGSDGMLFVFSRSSLQRFWMKDMQFPLDMLWLNDGTIAGITAHVPTPQAGKSLRELPLYGSETSVPLVLELVAGRAAALGLSQGDPFELYRIEVR